MFVDPAVITCYPTNVTVAHQNQYTRVICEYPSLPSPTARHVPFRHQFHFPGGRWFLILHAASNYTITRPPVSHMLPPYIPLQPPTNPPTQPNLDTSPAHPRFQPEFYAKALFYHPTFISVPYRTSYLFETLPSSQPLTRAPDLSCAAP